MPFAEVAASIDDATTVVVTTSSRCRPVRVARPRRDLPEGAGRGARVVVDSTRGTPFVPVAEHIGDIDVLVCHAYKHLLGGRGCAFLYVRQDGLDRLEPTFASWRGAADPWGTFFSRPPRAG